MARRRNPGEPVQTEPAVTVVETFPEGSFEQELAPEPKAAPEETRRPKDAVLSAMREWYGRS